MESVMGKLPGEAKRLPLDMKVEEEIDGETYVRRLVTYSSENRVARAGLLAHSNDVLAGRGRAPAVLWLHGTDNVIGHRHRRRPRKPTGGYALELAKRGYVTLRRTTRCLQVPAGPEKARLGERHAQSGVGQHARTRPPRRAALWMAPRDSARSATRWAATNSVYTAAFDDRLTVIVSSCGLDSYLDYYEGQSEELGPGKGLVPDALHAEAGRLQGPARGHPFDSTRMIGALAPAAHAHIAPTEGFELPRRQRGPASSPPPACLQALRPRAAAAASASPTAGTTPAQMREAAYKMFDEVACHTVAVAENLPGGQIHVQVLASAFMC